MLLRLAVRYLLRSVAVFALGASFAGGCSRQGEGERCDRWKAGGDSDCDSGLVCTRCEFLQDGTTDRCCPDGTQYSDSRCQPGTSTSCSVNSGTAGTTSTGGMSGTGGTESGGTSGGGTGGTDGGGSGGGEVGGQAGATLDDPQAGSAGG